MQCWWSRHSWEIRMFKDMFEEMLEMLLNCLIQHVEGELPATSTCWSAVHTRSSKFIQHCEKSCATPCFFLFCLQWSAQQFSRLLEGLSKFSFWLLLLIYSFSIQSLYLTIFRCSCCCLLSYSALIYELFNHKGTKPIGWTSDLSTPDLLTVTLQEKQFVPIF